MRVTICAAGRLRAGPEKALVDDYLRRFDRLGRGLGIGPARVVEIDDRRGGGTDDRMLAAIPPDAMLVALDERGDQLTSPEIASLLADTAAAGRRDLAFALGGADGLPPGLSDRADRRLAFGRTVWPHLLARAMLAEQLYRAASILAGTPYHRG